MVQIRIIDGKNYLDNDGDLLEITKSFVEKKTGKTWFYLPENSMNRKLIDETKMVDGYELKFRESRTVGSYNKTDKKPFWEYLNVEELEQYNKLVEIGMTRKKEAEKKPQLTEADKLRIRIEKMKQQLAELENEDEALKDAE